jgi:hypothetical protein
MSLVQAQQPGKQSQTDLAAALELQIALNTYSTNGIAGYTTYQAVLEFHGKRAKNVYAIYGDTKTSPAYFPPCYQVPPPFGKNTGPTNPAFWEIPGHSDAEFDSWLTMGTGPNALGNKLSSIGVSFNSWTDATPLTISDGAVFFMDPDIGPAASATGVVVAQVIYCALPAFCVWQPC